MAIRPIPPPINAPLAGPDGKVSREWADFFNIVFRYEQAIAKAADDGTYTVGIGTTDGELTIENGIITAVQEVVS